MKAAKINGKIIEELHETFKDNKIIV